MASNVIQQNRQRHPQHRQNCSRYLKLKSNRRCLRHHLKLKYYLSQHEQKSDEVQYQDNVKVRTIKHRKPRIASSKSKPIAFIQKQFKLRFQTSFEEFSEGIYRLVSASILMRFLLLLTFGQIVAGEGNIGCNFMRTLCLPGSEVCFDDNIFGKCIPIAGVDLEDIDRTPLTEDQSEKLATILLELQGAGLGWDHPYVQCRIQGQLFSMQRHTRLPPNLCANLAPIPSENDRNGDLAYVRFIPPLEDYVDAQDETEHNLLYYPPMKKQASVDTIFHELQQQELQRQRQQYQPNQSRQPNHLDFLQYGGFDDRSFRKPNHPVSFPGNTFIENERKHYPQDREISQTELDLARRKLFRMMSEYGLDQDADENPFQRNFEEDSSPLTGMYGPDQINAPSQQPNFFNPYMGGGTPADDEPIFYPSELDMARNRFHRMLANQDINEQNKRHNFMNTFSGNPRGHFDDQDVNSHNNFGPNRQKIYQVLSDYGLDKDPPDNRFLKAFEKTISNSQDNTPPMFDSLGFKDSYGEQSPNDFDNFRRMENKEPPKEEPAHRSFFRELAVEQGIKQSSPSQHEDKPAKLHNQEDKPFDTSRLIDKDRSENVGQNLLGNSLVRNSLKPFEEEAILSSNPLAHKAKHQKVDKVFTEGGLVLVPQNSYQNDEAPFNVYEDMEDVDLEKEKARKFLADMLGFTRHERLDVKKPGPMMGPPDSLNSSTDTKNTTKKTETKEVLPTHIKGSNEAHKMKKVIADDFSDEDSASLEDEFDYLYVYFKNPVKDREDAERIMIVLSEILHMQGFFDNLTILDNGVSFRVNSNNPEHKTSIDMAKYITDSKGAKKNILRRLGVTVLGANVGTKYKAYEDDDGVSVVTPYASSVRDMTIFTLVLILFIAIAALSYFTISFHRRFVREKLNLLAKGGGVSGMESCSKDYQDLCRARMAGKGNTSEPVASGRITSLSKENERPPSSRSSTSSWCEEPALTNMDISTGHMVLSYMEDHLRNKGRLQREWEALCRYEAEPSAREAAQQAQCANFNRSGAPLPYDHSRVVLNHLANAEGLDYINASSITDHDPRAPAYVAAQGPLPTTLAHFWQMIWEQGAVVIVSLCRLQENGEIACARYWPEEGAEVYHIYEVNLVSEHIWCDDYLVRSFYLKNLRTSETRTVTQFHFLSWPPNGVPAQAKALLDFRRKVNKSYRGRSCPIVVHGSTGAGRTGAYILLDLVLGRMNKGAREIDIAATLEHLRDQRAGLVATRQQFEFVLMAVAEEVHAILKALPANQSNEKKEIEGNKDGNGVNGSASGGALTGGVGSVAGVVLKEEEAENNEEEAKPAGNTTAQPSTTTPTPKENETKANGSKNGTPAKNSGNNSNPSMTSGQKKK